MQKSFPKISVCIPVFSTEPYLARCLRSVFTQSFSDFEIVIVNDGSFGTDENGWNCKKIVKSFQKEAKKLRKELKLPAVSFDYTEHRTNLGLLEARRTAVENAHGEYICILDSDDELLPEALSNMYNAAVGSNADIVQGRAEVFCSGNSEQDKKRAEKMLEKVNLLFAGELSGESVFNGFLLNKNHTAFLWGKLIRRTVYLEAFSHIPFTQCVFAEDVLQYFFISYAAKKYVGIENPVCRYTVDTGISSNRKIDDLKRWEKVCSTASVFTIIFDEVKKFEPPLNLELMEAIRNQSRSYLANNLKQLREAVVPELQKEAREMLCEYWGDSFVEKVEKLQKESAATSQQQNKNPQ